MSKSLYFIYVAIVLVFILSTLTVQLTITSLEKNKLLIQNSNESCTLHDLKMDHFYNIFYGQLYRYIIAITGSVLLLLLRIYNLPIQIAFFQDLIVTTSIAVVVLFCFVSFTETSLYEIDEFSETTGLLVSATMTRLLIIVLAVLFFWSQSPTTTTQFYTPPITYVNIYPHAEDDISAEESSGNIYL